MRAIRLDAPNERIAVVERHVRHDIEILAIAQTVIGPVVAVIPRPATGETELDFLFVLCLTARIDFVA